MPESIRGVITDPATYAFGLGGAAGGLAATKNAGGAAVGFAAGAIGPEDFAIEPGIASGVGAYNQGTSFFTPDASKVSPTVGIKPSDDNYDEEKERVDRERVQSQSNQMNILNDLLPEKKKKDTVLTPRTKAGGFQVPAFI